MVVINEYIARRLYNGKIIEVNVYDGFSCEQRITKLCCLKYCRDIITLSNPTDDQVKNEISNMIKIAEEIIDENSLINKIKRLFR